MKKAKWDDMKRILNNIQESKDELEVHATELKEEWDDLYSDEKEEVPDIGNLAGETIQLVYDISIGIDNVTSRMEDVKGELTE